MRTLLFVLCLLHSAPMAFAQDPTPNVPLSHPVYRTLDRFHARGWFKTPPPGLRPYTRKQTARFLLQILEAIHNGAQVSQTEQKTVQRHRAEFTLELAELGFPSVPTPQNIGQRLRNGGNLYAWHNQEASVFFDPLFRQRVLWLRGQTRPEETVSQTYVGGILRGTYSNQFGFQVRHFEAREWSTRSRTNRTDVIAQPVEDVQFKGHTIDFREAEFQAVYATSWFALDAGKSRFEWGPGRSGNLLLTNHSPPFGQLQLRASYGRVRWTHVIGFLRPRPTVIDTTRILIDNGHYRTFPREKHLAAHRVEIDLSPRITLGLHESVVYGDRSTEFLYATPITLFAAVQSYLGNTDNLLLGFDISFRPAKQVQTYLAVLFDDMVKFDPGAFANKFALQVGMFWVDPLGLPDTDFRLEYIRVEPYVYTHNFNINTYEHFDYLLGYPLGPNADNIYSRISHRFSSSLSLGLTLNRERQGENILNPDGTLVNAGGNAQQGRRPDDPPSKRFLEGILETRIHTSIELTYEPLRDLCFSLAYCNTRARNILRADAIRGNTTGHRLSITADLNFY